MRSTCALDWATFQIAVHCRVEALGQEGTEGRVLNRRSTTRGKSNKMDEALRRHLDYPYGSAVFLFIRALMTAAPGGVLTAVFMAYRAAEVDSEPGHAAIEH
jgi:hypothetical protein